MPKQPITIPIARRALLVRVNRALRMKGLRLRADHRGGRISYCLIDLARQAVVRTEVDLEDMARKLGRLQPWERLEEDEGPEPLG